MNETALSHTAALLFGLAFGLIAGFVTAFIGWLIIIGG
jgi:hypothetical protein